MSKKEKADPQIKALKVALNAQTDLIKKKEIQQLIEERTKELNKK